MDEKETAIRKLIETETVLRFFRAFKTESEDGREWMDEHINNMKYVQEFIRGVQRIFDHECNR
jgi:hypothetical protein